MDSVVAQPPSSAHLPFYRRRWWRITRNILLGVLAFVFAIWLVLFITKGRFLKHTFEHLASGAVQRPVQVAGDFQLYFDPFEIKFVAEGLSVANPAWATRPLLFHADRIDSRIAPLSLIFGRRHIRDLTLTNAAIDLEWDNAHQRNSWTFGDPNVKGKPFEMPRIDRATLAGTQVRYLDDSLKLLADIRLDTIRSADAKIGARLGFAGDGEVRGTPFTTRGALLSPDATVGGGENKLQLHLDAAHNAIDIAGTLPGLTEIENVPLAVKASGRNLNELLGIIGISLPNTRHYAIAATLVQSGIDYRFTHLVGSFGDSDLSGRFTISAKEPRTYVWADLQTRSLDIVDVAPFIGYNPDLVAAGDVKAAAHAGPDRILPDTPLDVEGLSQFDADVKYAVTTVKSKHVPVSNIALTLSLHDRLLKLSPLDFTVSQGSLSADILLDARRHPVHASYDIRLASTPMGKLLGGFGVADSGTSGTIKGRITLTGDGDSVHKSLADSHGRIALIIPKGTFWTRNVQLSELDLGTFAEKMFEHRLKQPVTLNCGLIGFTVRDGVAAADPILIDTSQNVILGRGGFSFKTEALDLAFRADAKKFSLFSGQSPVGLNGHFASPGIQVVSKQLLTRAGAAVGLGLVATPLAAVLAFVDVGDAKAAACGPVLAGATASQQLTTKGKPRTDVGHGTTAKEGSGNASGGEKKDQKKKFLGVF
ncbi:AsmA family protein [Sphingomonas bacterium]|uniref:AsmA family protein n=1 Tax=Sphingomonas bacterium TaxID=1895847 RepID=UPI001576922B|nr:AsmA family protein [Sphingomonas bacterium]